MSTAAPKIRGLAVLAMVSTMAACQASGGPEVRSVAPARAAFPETRQEAVLSIAPMLERVTPAVVNVAVEFVAPPQRHPIFEDPVFRRYFGVPDDPPPQLNINAGSGVVVWVLRGR